MKNGNKGNYSGVVWAGFRGIFREKKKCRAFFFLIFLSLVVSLRGKGVFGQRTSTSLLHSGVLKRKQIANQKGSKKKRKRIFKGYRRLNISLFSRCLDCWPCGFCSELFFFSAYVHRPLSPITSGPLRVIVLHVFETVYKVAQLSLRSLFKSVVQS